MYKNFNCWYISGAPYLYVMYVFNKCLEKFLSYEPVHLLLINPSYLRQPVKLTPFSRTQKQLEFSGN